NATHLGRLKLAHARCRLIVSLEQPSQCVELALSLAIAPHRHRCPTIPDQSIGRTSLPCPERSVIVSGGSTASPLKIDVPHRTPQPGSSPGGSYGNRRVAEVRASGPGSRQSGGVVVR